MKHRRDSLGRPIPDNIPEYRKIEIHSAEHPPTQDGRLVVAWRNDWPLPCVYEWRQAGKKKGFYSGAAATNVDFWVYLEDLTGNVDAVNAIRARWNDRDGYKLTRGFITATPPSALSAVSGPAVEKLTRGAVRRASLKFDKKMRKELKKL